MIKNLPFLLVIVSVLISCEAEEFDAATFQSTDDSIVTEDTIDGEGDNDIIIIDGDETDNTDPCITPEGLTINEITNQTANITWSVNTARVNGQSWEVRYAKKVSISETTPTILSAESNTILINNLESSTVYEVFVRTNCGAGNYSEWSKAVEVTTL